jgi:hypothetical protein
MQVDVICKHKLIVNTEFFDIEIIPELIITGVLVY